MPVGTGRKVRNIMRLAFAILASACTLAASDPQTKPAPAAPAKVIKPLTIPPGAVEKEQGRFYFTDAQGKKWIYYKTPWGISRGEDKPAAETAKPVDDFAGVKI